MQMALAFCIGRLPLRRENRSNKPPAPKGHFGLSPPTHHLTAWGILSAQGCAFNGCCDEKPSGAGFVGTSAHHVDADLRQMADRHLTWLLARRPDLGFGVALIIW